VRKKGQKKMDNETDTTFKRIAKRLVKTNLILLVALALIAAIGIKDLITTTKTTNKLSEVAQKVGVEFPTKTNNVFGVWKVVKPL
jgi:hypothetical protein